MLTPSKYIKIVWLHSWNGKAICYEWASRGVSIVAVAIDSLLKKNWSQGLI